MFWVSEYLGNLRYSDSVFSLQELQMLLQKCYLLHGHGKIDEFLESGKQLLFQEWKDVEADESKFD